MRAAALARRDALAPEMRAAASEAAARHALPFLSGLSGRVLSGYWPIRSEADPRPLLTLACASGARLALPVLDGPDTLRFRLWDETEPLVPAGFGTLGPPPSAEPVLPDIIVMPLAAFDRGLHRIGYGKGHYDRAVDAMRRAGRRPLLVGLAFAAQEVEKVPFEPHDIPLDAVVTEDGLIAADRR